MANVTLAPALNPAQPRKIGFAEKVGGALVGGLQSIGGAMERAGQETASVVTRPIAATISAGRGLGNLAAAGGLAAIGKKDAAIGLLQKEGLAQQSEQRRPDFVRPPKNMAESLGVGLKLGSAMGAGALSPLVAATSAPGWVTGATAAGIPALPASVGIGLEHVKPELGIAKNVENVAMTGVKGTLGAMAVGGTIGALGDWKKAQIAAVQGKVDKAAAQIAQSKVGDAAQDKRALLRISPEERANVKTYSDLGDVIDDNLDALREAQDKLHAGIPGERPLASFEKTSGLGANAVKSNPVETALADLEDLYRKTNDPEALSKILALKDKAMTTGLSVSEVNQVARDYGRNYEAFSPKTGLPATSLTKQGYENTRTAVKEAARSGMSEADRKVSEAADSAMSDLLELKRATAIVEEKVNALNNKIAQRGLGERIGRLLGFIVDKATFGAGKGFVTKAFFPSGLGEKELNYLDIQKALPKNLRILDSMASMNDDELVNAIVKLVKPPLGGTSLLSPPK